MPNSEHIHRTYMYTCPKLVRNREVGELSCVTRSKKKTPKNVLMIPSVVPTQKRWKTHLPCFHIDIFFNSSHRKWSHVLLIQRNFLTLLHDVDVSNNICFIYRNLCYDVAFSKFPLAFTESGKTSCCDYEIMNVCA